MRVLIIAEGKKNSANLNIAKKIRAEMERQGIEIYFAYYLTNQNVECNNESNEFIIQPDLTKRFITFRDGCKWKSFSKAEKVIWMLRNIKMTLSYLFLFIDERTGMNYAASVIDRICEKNNIDVVLGITFPYIIAELISKVKKCKGKYIYQLDPYTYNRMLDSKDINRRLRKERKVIKSVSNCFTTDLIKRDLIDDVVLNEYKEKMVEIEFPLVEEEGIKNGEYTNIIDKEAGQISFLHAGSFYRDIRNPEKLARLFKLLPQNYILYVAGDNTNSILKYFNKNDRKIVDLGLLSAADAEEARREADFLISYNNTIDNQVPSKLFECINSCKPFLNLCQIKNCPTLKYVREYNMACNYYIGNDNSIDAIVDFVEEKLGSVEDKSVIMKRFKKCTTKYVVDKMLAYMKSDE